MPVMGENAHMSLKFWYACNANGSVEYFDTTLSTTRLRGIVSHTLLNRPNSQPFTCTNTPVRFTIQIPDRATQIDWLMGRVQGISPAKDTSLFFPVLIDSFMSGGKMFFTYPLEGDYLFTDVGVKTIGMRYYHPTIRTVTGSETSSYEVRVIDGPEVEVSVVFEGCTGEYAQLSGETFPWRIPVNEFIWQINGITIGNQIQQRVAIENEGPQPVTFLAIAENGCAGKATSMIEAAPLPKIAMERHVNVCEDKPVEIKYTSAIASGQIRTWEWNLPNSNSVQRTNGAPFMQDFTKPGIYEISVQAVSDKGCKSNITFQTVAVHKSPKVTLALSGKPCVDSSLQWVSYAAATTDRIIGWHWLDDAGNLSSSESASSAFFRLNASQTASPLRHWVTTASGCMRDTTITPPVIVHENPIVEILVNKDTLCAGQTLLLSANLPISIGSHWDWHINTKNIFREPPFEYPVKEAGTINIKLRYQNAEGCAAKEVAKTIYVAPLPVVDAGPDLKTQRNTTVKMLAPGATDAIAYSWTPALLVSNPDILNTTALVQTDTKFLLTATNAYGCKGSDEMKIIAIDNIYIPSAFSPNGDGLNDIWRISGLSSEHISTVIVYDRYGQIVFQSKGYEHHWDGGIGGKALPTGNYVYVLDPGDGGQKRKGNLTLIR